MRWAREALFYTFITLRQDCQTFAIDGYFIPRSTTAIEIPRIDPAIT